MEEWVVKSNKKLEYITLTAAANQLKITKLEMRQLVEERQITKYFNNGYRYLLKASDVDRLRVN